MKGLVTKYFPGSYGNVVGADGKLYSFLSDELVNYEPKFKDVIYFNSEREGRYRFAKDISFSHTVEEEDIERLQTTKLIYNGETPFGYIVYDVKGEVTVEGDDYRSGKQNLIEQCENMGGNAAFVIRRHSKATVVGEGSKAVHRRRRNLTGLLVKSHLGEHVSIGAVEITALVIELVKVLDDPGKLGDVA